MKNTVTLIYDGSFNGFLSAVYTAFERKIVPGSIQRESAGQNELFEEVLSVKTDIVKAKRVWYGLRKRNQLAVKNTYFAFLSEAGKIEILLFNYIRSFFDEECELTTDEKKEVATKVAHWARLVSLEKQRLETSLMLQPTGQGHFLAETTPAFNVLPLIAKYFRLRFPDKAWVIYDRRRRYGLYTHNGQSQLVSNHFVKHLREAEAAASSGGRKMAYRFDEMTDSSVASTNPFARIAS